MMQGGFNLKLSADLQGQWRDSIGAENAIRTMAKEITIRTAAMDNTAFFIPDHLAFGCEEGVWLSEIITPFFRNSVVRRRTVSSEKGFMPNRGLLENAPDSNDRILEVVFDETTAVMYVLWDERLIRIDGKTGFVTGQFSLPFKGTKGWLTVVERFLLLGVVDANDEHSRWMAFSDPDAQSILNPLRIYTEAELGMLKTRAVGAGLSNGQMDALVISQMNGANYLTRIPLIGMGGIEQFLLEGSDINTLTAVNVKKRGIADRIYYGDQDALWCVELDREGIHKNSLRKWHGIRLEMAPLVVPDAAGEGVRLYGIGESLGERGLFLIRDNHVPSPSKVQLIRKGDYLQSFIRFGELWLVPKNSIEAVAVLQLPNHGVNRIAWKPVVSEGRGGGESAQSAYAKIVWDPSLQTEMLIVFDNSYELTILAATRPSSCYGTIAWRRNIVDKIN
jgi:hypothetical protein